MPSSIEHTHEWAASPISPDGWRRGKCDGLRTDAYFRTCACGEVEVVPGESLRRDAVAMGRIWNHAAA